MVNSDLISKLVLGISLLLISATHTFANETRASTAMVFGVYPQENASYSQYWKSLVEQVSLNSGQNIRFEMAADTEEFEQKLSSGAYDFVLLNAHMYTQAHDAIGYKAFAKEKGIEVFRAPFGYYKEFVVKVKGHPLAELSKTIA